ncbi:hypothetical protein D3C72_1361740 [compost metagenome]
METSKLPASAPPSTSVLPALAAAPPSTMPVIREVPVISIRSSAGPNEIATPLRPSIVPLLTMEAGALGPVSRSMAAPSSDAIRPALSRVRAGVARMPCACPTMRPVARLTTVPLSAKWMAACVLE